MLKYCGDELDPKRTLLLLDYNLVEVAQQMALAARADFSARATELRAWMKDAADAHGSRLPEHQAHHQPVFNRISRWVALDLVRITDDAQIGIELVGDAAFMDAIQGAVERGMGIGDGVVLPIAFALLALMARSVGARAALGGGAVARRLGARRVRLG
jgi:hypothetical protein